MSFARPRHCECLAQLPQQIWELGDIRRDQTHLSVSRVSILIFVRDYLRRSRPRVQIAKAAITGEYVAQMVARLECAVLAVPVQKGAMVGRAAAYRSLKKQGRPS